MKNKFQSKTYPQGSRTLWRYLSAFILLFSLGIGQMWGVAPATSSDSKTVSGTVTFADVTSLSAQTTYWYNGVKLYSYAATNANAANSLWTSAVTSGVYYSSITAGSSWGSYAMSGLVMAQHAVAAHVKGEGTITVVINNTRKDYATFDSNFKAYRVAANKYGDNYTTSTYKNAESGTEITSGLSISCESGKGRYTISYDITDAMLDANDEVIIKFYYGSSGTGAGKWFCYESVTFTPATSGPVDPTITFNNGAYTVGDAALDLSSLFSSNSAGAVTYSVKTDGGTSASIDGTNFTATAAGTCVVTASQAAETGKYNAKAVDANIVVSAACTKPDAPEGLDVDSKTHNSATIGWDGTGLGTNGYKIALESASGAGTFDWDDATLTTYTATGLTPNTNYTFKVKYKGKPAEGQCDFSDVVSVNFKTDAEPLPATGDATITYALSGSTATGTVSGVSSISGLSTSLTLSTLTLEGTKDGYSGAIKGCTSTTELVEADYVDVQFTVASGYVFTPSAVSVKVNPFNATSAVRAVVALQDAALDVRSEVLACDKNTDNAVVFADGAFTGKEFEGTVHVRMYFYGPTSSKAFYIKSPIEITGSVDVAPTKYDLEFAANGGEGTMSTLKYKSGVEVTLPACTFDAPSASQEFDAWVVTKKVGGASVTVTDGKFTMPTEAVVATATWKTKDVKYTVTYKDGATTIGTEEVIAGGHPAEYAAKQSKNLAAFVGWYSDADLADGHLISDIAAEVISADKTVYGKWTYTYAQSVNVEKWVLDNGKTPNSDKTGALVSLFGTRGFASNLAYVENNLELDSLNDSKGTGRNYAYLGLKVKVAGKMLDFRLAKDSYVKVKFGEIKSTLPQVSINGGEYENMTLTEKVWSYTATGNDYISIKTADANAVVFQQIMIGEDIQDVTLPEPTRHAVVLTKAGETEHGTLAVASPETYNWLAENTAVTLTVAADEGYYIESVTLNGDALTPSENVYSFAMPNATANVVATFAEIIPNDVTYMPNGATSSVEYVIDYNATVILGCPAQFSAPANTKFDGWNTDPAGNGDAYAAGDPVLSPLQLYAQWRSYFTITYMDGETELDTEDVFVGEAPVGIADPVKAMNIFKGWTLAGSDEVIDVTTLNATTTVYAKWEAIDACFYFSAKSVTEDEAITAPANLDNAFGGTLEATDGTFTYTQYGVLIAGGGSKYFTVNLNYALQEGSKITVKMYAGGTSERGLNLRVAGSSSNVYQYKWTPSATEPAQMEYEYEYVVPENSPLIGKKVFYLYRNNNVYLQTVKVSNCAPQDYTVTYKDGETVLGTEQVFENEHPTADGINTHKKGYEFQGWAETVDGAVVDLDDITITAAKNLFAQYTVKDCSPKGVKFSMAIDGSKISANQYYPATTPAVGDLAVFATVTGGVAQAVNTSTGTTKNFEVKTTPEFKLGGANSHMRILLDCPLAENDTIKFDKTEKIKLSFDSLKTSAKTVSIAKTTSYYVVPAAYAGEDTIHIWYDNSGVSVNGVQVIRPEVYTVSFNLMGHGSAIAPVDVVKGGKITAPTAPTDEDNAFAGWYKENTLENEWDFDNDVVATNTTLYAKWIDMTDATLKSLKYGTTDIELLDGVYTYEVSLPSATVAVPALTAETSNPNATADVTDAAAFVLGQATSTVLVTPEKVGAATQTYTVNFTIAQDLAQVDVTGYMEWNFSLAGTTSLQNQTDVVLANMPGIVNNATFNSQALKGTFNKLQGDNHSYQGSVLHFHTTVPGKVTVEFSGTNGNTRRLTVVNNAGITEVEWEFNSSSTHQTKSVVVPAGDVTLRAFEGENAQNARIYYMEFDPNLDPTKTGEATLGGFERDVPEGQYGTICLPNGGVMVGASIYTLAYYGETSQKIFFDEVLNGTMEAGKPYLFFPNESVNHIGVFYTDAANEAAQTVNGFVGYIGASADAYIQVPDGEGCYIVQNNMYREVLTGATAYILSNRAYIKKSQISHTEPAKAPGARRIGIGGQNQMPTGLDAIEASEKPMKIMIDGQMYILRGEKMYDAKGQLVK